jgi:hypothetical protein
MDYAVVWQHAVSAVVGKQETQIYYFKGPSSLRDDSNCRHTSIKIYNKLPSSIRNPVLRFYIHEMNYRVHHRARRFSRTQATIRFLKKEIVLYNVGRYRSSDSQCGLQTYKLQECPRTAWFQQP